MKCQHYVADMVEKVRTNPPRLAVLICHVAEAAAAQVVGSYQYSRSVTSMFFWSSQSSKTRFLKTETWRLHAQTKKKQDSKKPDQYLSPCKHSQFVGGIGLLKKQQVCREEEHEVG